MKTLVLSFFVVLMTLAASATSLDDAKKELAASNRSVSEMTIGELNQLETTPGGFFANMFTSEYVFRIGRSTFIINNAWLTLVGGSGALIIVFFFTPIGLSLFRGNLHRAVGLVLTPIFPDFGKHVRNLPMKYLSTYGGRRGFALYMHNAFIPEYKNNITAVAFLGTAFLIMSIGLRGVKFMVAHEPTMIIIAIVIEIIVLCLLGLTTWYEKSLNGSNKAVIEGVDKDAVISEVESLTRRIKSL